MNKNIGYIFTVLTIFIFCPFSYARRIRPPNYPLIRYRVIDTGLCYSDYISSERYPFQLAIIDYPEGVALWLRKKEYWGQISKDSTLVVLSPFLDYNHEVFSELEKTNWLNYICKYELVREIYVILPNYIQKYPDWRNSLHRIAKEAREVYDDSLYLIDRLSDLPEGEKLGSVVLVIDLSFFSNSKFPYHKPELEELIFQINSINLVLKNKGIRLEALIIVESPEFTYNEHIRMIEEQFLEILRDDE